uniref:Multiple myeloma tumor-associated protein 2-like N-terminal domain-containing protein n=1 Tax=Pyramimonas obovata TaxID=1411642 RepID=A0A7S0N389_9CHLO|mmetsp:Transcript_19683/g.43014  ORF Transcript_19683/g.43014 Transcript_19683/m.43014 type:complete len:232 (+) Transcript_19683:74-769(+)
MSLYNGPARGGTRGGKDQFKWEDVKTDQDRECYLGHSVMAPVGRWQKNKDILWYTREKGDAGSSLDEEKRAIKEQEEQLMREALGLAPKRERKAKSTMDQKEYEEFLRGGAEEEPDRENPDRVKGLGNSRLGVAASADTVDRETLPGIEAFERPYATGAAPGEPGPGGMRELQGGKRKAESSDSGSDSDSSRERKKSKKSKKDKKREKKEKKKQKKEAKKQRKEEKRSRKE